jgi:hypothetical protein
MKKVLLLSIALCIGFIGYSQQYPFKVKVGEDKHPQQLLNEQNGDNSVVPPAVIPPKPDYQSGTPSRAIDVRDLGSAGNAWGLSSGGRTFMWADNDVESVVFLHRMDADPGTGYLAYDVSTDMGDTWEINQQVWDPTNYPSVPGSGNARYPMIAIYNPEGNTDPANAIMTFYAPTLEQTNGGSWGGIGIGTNPLAAVNPTTPTQSNLTSEGDFLYAVPDAFHMLSDGKAISIEPALVEGLFDNYTGNMVITSGYYDAGTMLFDYEQELFPFDVSGGSVAGGPVRVTNSKLAFHPDGQTGYMAMLTNNGGNDLAEGTYYPILFKTTDGGLNWDGPYNVQLGGPDGLPAVLNYLTDDLLEMLYEPPIPDRTELLFTTAFDFDVAVDINGNPHLLFVVGLGSGEWSIYTSIEGLPGTGGMIALIHAASYGDMETWYADTVNTPHTFRGEFPGSTGSTISEDLRPYISVTPDGSKMFFSWQNTVIENINDNSAPDIYCIGYNVNEMSYTEVFNVTAFTPMMWQSWMATASYYVFDHGDGNYEIPFVAQIMDPGDNIAPVDFKYADNFIINDEDFGAWVSVADVEPERIAITQNYPNPFSNVTYVDMTLSQAANVTLEISNIIGQKVRTVDYGFFGSGLHKISIAADGLESGIYFYTLNTGSDAVTRKMIVE